MYFMLGNLLINKSRLRCRSFEFAGFSLELRLERLGSRSAQLYYLVFDCLAAKGGHGEIISGCEVPASPLPFLLSRAERVEAFDDVILYPGQCHEPLQIGSSHH